MKVTLALAASIIGASAYPFAMEHVGESEIEMDMDKLTKRAGLSPLQVSQQEGNCGPIPCVGFNAAQQFTSTSGAHKYIKPGPGDIRGPCPGLNAAANHGYLNRNGIQTIQSTQEGLAQAYSFARDFAAALAIFSSVISGDIITQQWSIGGPMPALTLGGILTTPGGISNSHNAYEGDVSIARYDAYTNNGDAHSLSIARFKRAYEYCTNDRCTLDKFRAAFLENVYWSINNNAYYFSPPLAGAIVPPAAYNFVINFMSNHSAAEPQGYLDRKQFMQFFAVTGTYPNFKWLPGQERIPDNWYRRTTANPYGAVTLAADDVIGWAARPDSFRIGGNTNGVNTYKGVDVSLLTGGTYSSPADLLKGNNAGCLLLQLQQQAVVGQLEGLETEGAALLSAFNGLINPLISKLQCPQLNKYDGSLFNPYPGYHYNPYNSTNSSITIRNDVTNVDGR